MEQVALASRAFLRRTVTYLADEAGIRQFLDIGTGIPAAGNTHEVAQAVDPSCRVVYVDNDPVVLSHARARLRSSPEGATSYIDADARDTKAIMAGAGADPRLRAAGRRHHDRHPELPRGRGRRARPDWSRP